MGSKKTGALARSIRRIGNALHPDVTVEPAPENVRAEWDVAVPTRDGTTLRVNVFRPMGEERVPVIMSAHPYGKDNVAGRRLNVQYRICPQPHTTKLSAWTSWEAPDPAVWVPRGYAVVNVDLRGAGTSEGVGDLFSDQEALDYYDVIEWAGTQPWSTGRVGLDGVSYLAISQYKVAALRPPHLAAICPWEGFSDLYRDFARPGGVREDGFTVLWAGATKKAARILTDIRKAIVDHVERDAWYESVTPDLARIEVPILVCGSFSDQSLHTRGSFEVFRRAGSTQKWLYTHRDGKWCAYYGEEATAARGRFFDYTLKGVDNGWKDEPAVRLAIYEEGAEPVAVVGEDAWPPKDLDWTPLSLDAAYLTLVDEDRVEEASRTSFDMRGGPASFTWAVPEDMDLIGPMALRLYVELEGATDIFLFVGVRKFRAGAELTFEGSFGFGYDMVSKGWQRSSHRELEEDLSTPEQPVHTHTRSEPFKPGEIVPVDLALLPHATRFRKGDVLRLDVRGTWHFPKDPLRGTFPTKYQSSSKGSCVLHTGGQYDARLLIGRRPVRK